VEPTPPSEVDGSSNGSPSETVDAWLAKLLVGELRIRVDPLTGEIIATDPETGDGAPDQETSPPDR